MTSCKSYCVMFHFTSKGCWSSLPKNISDGMCLVDSCKAELNAMENELNWYPNLFDAYGEILLMPFSHFY